MERETRCPEMEVLERYAGGVSVRGEAVECEEHLRMCGLCSLVVERLRELPAAGGLEEEPEGWTEVSARVEAEIRRRVKRAERRRGWVGWVWTPAVAYALAALLMYPAWLGIRSNLVEAPVVPGVPPARAAMVVDLNATRGPGRVAEVPGGEKSAVALMFFVPTEGEGTLSAVIEDSRGTAAIQGGELRSYDGRGNYCLVVDAGGMAAGQYKLRVKESAGRETTFEFVRR